MVNKFEHCLIILTLSLCMFAWDPLLMGQFLREGRNNWFLIGCAGLASIHIAKRWHWSIGLFYMYAITLLILYRFPAFSVSSAINMTATLLMIPIFFDKITPRTFENIILVAATGHGILATLNCFNIYIKIAPGVNHYYDLLRPIVGLFGQHMFLAIFMVFALGIALTRGIFERKAYLPLALFFAVIVILSKSSIGFISMVTSIGVIGASLIGLVPILLMGSIATAAVAYAYYKNPDLISFSGRLKIWQIALDIHMGKPVEWDGFKYQFNTAKYFGFLSAGWSQIANTFVTKADPRPWTELHNEYLQALVDFGRVGIVLIANIFKQVILRTSFRVRELPYVAGFAAISVNALGSYPMRVTPIGQIAMICVYQILKQLTKPKHGTQ